MREGRGSCGMGGSRGKSETSNCFLLAHANCFVGTCVQISWQNNHAILPHTQLIFNMSTLIW